MSSMALTCVVYTCLYLRSSYEVEGSFTGAVDHHCSNIGTADCSLSLSPRTLHGACMVASLTQSVQCTTKLNSCKGTPFDQLLGHGAVCAHSCTLLRATPGVM
jgi:hypothetical protein